MEFSFQEFRQNQNGDPNQCEIETGSWVLARIQFAAGSRVASNDYAVHQRRATSRHCAFLTSLGVIESA
jgi:hypothetical protein